MWKTTAWRKGARKQKFKLFTNETKTKYHFCWKNRKNQNYKMNLFEHKIHNERSIQPTETLVNWQKKYIETTRWWKKKTAKIVTNNDDDDDVVEQQNDDFFKSLVSMIVVCTHVLAQCLFIGARTACCSYTRFDLDPLSIVYLYEYIFLLFGASIYRLLVSPAERCALARISLVCLLIFLFWFVIFTKSL